MLTLLTPSALLALMGLLVPLAIHLWNRRPGREVAVGSLRWLAAGANRRLRNLKLEQLWLLLLRAAVLGALALALAGPAWRQTLPAGRGQVLLSSEVLGTPALATLRPLIDSLRRQGFGLRWLDSSFGRVPLVAWQPDSAGGPADSGKVVQAAAATIGRFSWARVQQAAGAFPGQPLHVFTTGTLRDFAGSHSPLASNIFWHAVPESEAKSWVQSATLFGDSLRLLLGLSTEAQTTFRRVAQVRPAVNDLVRLSGLAPLRYEKADDTFRLVAADTAGAGKPFSRPVPVRTRPIQAVIYTTAAYALDARYLQAGLDDDDAAFTRDPADATRHRRPATQRSPRCTRCAGAARGRRPRRCRRPSGPRLRPCDVE